MKNIKLQNIKNQINIIVLSLLGPIAIAQAHNNYTGN